MVARRGAAGVVVARRGAAGVVVARRGAAGVEVARRGVLRGGMLTVIPTLLHSLLVKFTTSAKGVSRVCVVVQGKGGTSLGRPLGSKLLELRARDRREKMAFCKCT